MPTTVRRRLAPGRRRPLTAVLAVVLAATPAATSAAADEGSACAQSVAACFTSGDPFILIPGKAKVVATTVPVKPTVEARQTYAEMVPDGFGMPEQPRFLLHAAEYFAGTDVPVVQDLPGAFEGTGGAGWGTHWMEMSLHMRVARTLPDATTEEGWYFVGIGTDGNIAYGGIDGGYPKYRAETAFDSSSPNLWSASATVTGRAGVAHAQPDTRSTALRVTWQRSLGAALPADSGMTNTGYFQNPVHAGPETIRTVGRFLAAADTSWLSGGSLPQEAAFAPLTGVDVRPGQVAYDVEPDLSLYDDGSEKVLPDLLAGTGSTLTDVIETSGTRPGWAFEVTQGYLFTQNAQIRRPDGSPSGG